MKYKMLLGAAALLAASATANAQANVQITEIMYTGLFGEFVEITNVGNADANLAATGGLGNGWTFSDSSATTGVNATSLSQVGLLAPNASAIITEVSDAIFIQAWYTEPTTNPVTLAASQIVENNAINLGRTDSVNINTETGAVVDTVKYTDQSGQSGYIAADVGPRSEDVSARPDATLPGAGLGALFGTWKLSQGATLGNAWKAGVTGAPGPFGSPGKYPN